MLARAIRAVFRSRPRDLAGDRWAVIGVDGAGKSALLEMVAGVLAPDSGTVHLAPP